MKTETQSTHKSLSFDGCGINGRDEYRTRIATFVKKRGPVAQEYGPLFAAAPDLLAALERIAANPEAGPADVARDAIARAKGVQS